MEIGSLGPMLLILLKIYALGCILLFLTTSYVLWVYERQGTKEIALRRLNLSDISDSLLFFVILVCSGLIGMAWPILLLDRLSKQSRE